MPSEVHKATTLPDLSVRIMLRMLQDEGLDSHAALEAAGLGDGLPGLPGDIATSQEIAFQRAFVATTGYRPDLWLKTGLRYHLPCYGGLGMALITSPDLGEMVSTGIASRELDYSLARIEPIRQDGALRGQSIDVSAVPAVLGDFTIYRDLGAILTALQDVWNGRFPVRRIELAMPRPGRAFSVSGYPIVFGAERNAIIWDSELSRRKLYYGDPVLHAAYIEQCRARARVLNAKDDLVDVLEAMLAGGAGSPLSLAGLAAQTGQSERTLQRRLLGRGVRFRDLADEARRRVAIDLLTTTSTPISEIAWRLGYAETTSFNHAFRRWTGVNPAAIRRGRAAAPG